MPWLVRDGKVLATIEVATSVRARTRGLLGRDGIDGAILLEPARSVHTIRMRFPIDVAFCDRDLRVLKIVTLPTNRITAPVRHARCVVEAEAGTMGRWGIRVGDQLHVRGRDANGADGVAGVANAADVDGASGDGDGTRDSGRGGAGEASGRGDGDRGDDDGRLRHGDGETPGSTPR